LTASCNQCDEYRNHLRDEVTGVSTCGTCVYICPYGKRNRR